MRGMRTTAAALAIVATLVGCRSRGETGPSAPASVVAETPRVPPSDAGAAARDAAPEAPIAPRVPDGWSTVPDGKSTLSYVVDGYCAQIRVAPTKSGALVYWGEGTGYIGRVTDRGLADVEELSRGLPGAHDYREVIESANGELYVDANTGGRASMSAAIFHRTPKGWETVIETKLDSDAGFFIYHLLGSFGKGALATVSHCVDGCRSAGLMGVGETLTKNLSWEGEPYVTSWIGDDGTVALGGERCGREPDAKCACAAKVVLADGTSKSLALDAEHCSVSIAGASARNVVLASGPLLARFDGSEWHRIPGPRGGSLRVEALDASGRAWVSNDAKLYREKDGAWEDVSPPGGLGDATHGKRVDGVGIGEVWAVTKSGGIARTPAAAIAWEPVTVPLPPFAAIKKPPGVAGVVVAGRGDAWVNVSYGTQFEGTPSVETRRALLRTKAPPETLRCGGRSGLSGTAPLEPWPPRGTPECKTLAVVIAKASRSPEMFPRTRAILKGHEKELGASLELVVVGRTTSVADTPYVVATVPSYDVALKLATLVGKKAPFGVVPEIVCAAPEGERVRVDVATGEVVPPAGSAAPAGSR